LRRIVVVSNRVMDLRRAAQAGGVAVAIADLMRSRPCLWFGWDGKVTEAADAAPPALKFPKSSVGRGALATLPLTSEEHREYYLGYSNSVLWPVFHHRLDLAGFDAGYFARYLGVNARFARALAPLIRPDDLIWVHDFHLIPLAAELRRAGIDNPIGFYLHIPVPPSQTFLAIPEHKALAEDLSCYDLIGVQTKPDVANLIQFFEDSVGGRILQDGRINAFERRLRIARFPVGIDVADFVQPTARQDPAPLADDVQRIIGVDRLDYTKGLPQKFRAFGRFLEKYPQYRRRVVLSQIAPPTRESVKAYTDIRRTLEALSGKINGMFGELDWVPIHYIHRSTPRDLLSNIFRASRIGSFTPLRDGMNLVAKEYIASQNPEDPGVPILSRFAGAAEQLVDALIVNPYNVEEMADAIKTALEMEKAERVARHARLMAVLRTYDASAWSTSFISALESAGAERTALKLASGASIQETLARLERGAYTPPVKKKAAKASPAIVSGKRRSGNGV